ncbi:MAG TPA: hypothetical protein VHC95_05135 [Opitutales bacterium]|nr:hypothetical protein [Opitutales bacterium]
MNLQLRFTHPIRRLLIALVLSMALSASTFGMTQNSEVTPEYLKQHEKEFSVKVSKNKNGLWEFTITHNATVEWYVVASLTLSQAGNLTAETFFPPFVKKDDITFTFRVAPAFVAESEFELGDCAFGRNGEQIVPLPGTHNYIFKLKDFVIPELLQSTPAPVTPPPGP